MDWYMNNEIIGIIIQIHQQGQHDTMSLLQCRNKFQSSPTQQEHFSQVCQRTAHWSHCSDDVLTDKKQLVTGLIFINPSYCLNSKLTPPNCDWLVASNNRAVTSKMKENSPCFPPSKDQITQFILSHLWYNNPPLTNSSPNFKS